ncbi:hypothetical protein NY08_4860 [Rhodococcus sp. B7740]|nr:hypothetical protein NY08_4860 [Rhodococcus sp. B7740]
MLGKPRSTGPGFHHGIFDSCVSHDQHAPFSSDPPLAVELRLVVPNNQGSSQARTQSRW